MFSGYGFGFQRVDVFSRLLEECQEVLDVKNPDSLTWEERRSQRLASEDVAFDSDHYLCDLFEAENVEFMWKAKSRWNKGLFELLMKIIINPKCIFGRVVYFNCVLIKKLDNPTYFVIFCKSKKDKDNGFK